MEPKAAYQICRVCLDVDPPTPLHSLVDEDVRNLFEECISIKIKVDGTQPNQLCEECFVNCLNWHSFKSRAVKADQRIKRSTKWKSVQNRAQKSDNEQTTGENISSSNDIKLENEASEEPHAEESTGENDSPIPSDDVKWENIPTEEPQSSSGKPKKSTGKDEKRPRKRLPARPIVCEYCGLSFLDHSLKYHIRMKHLDSPKFTCKLCDKTFGQLNNLRLHEMRRHTGIKEFQCDQCDKAYFRKYDLTEHIDFVHNKIKKRFACDQCEASYNFIGQLNEHKLVHTGEKPFRCDQCYKSFNVRGRLLRHQRGHSGEKPFVCGVCGFACNRKENLKLHEKIHNK